MEPPGPSTLPRSMFVFGSWNRSLLLNPRTVHQGASLIAVGLRDLLGKGIAVGNMLLIFAFVRKRCWKGIFFFAFFVCSITWDILVPEPMWQVCWEVWFSNSNVRKFSVYDRFLARPDVKKTLIPLTTGLLMPLGTITEKVRFVPLLLCKREEALFTQVPNKNSLIRWASRVSYKLPCKYT